MCLYLDHVDNMTDHRCVFSKVFLRKILYLINEMTIQPNIHINIQLKIVVKLCIKPYKVASNCYCDFFFLLI